MWSHDNFAKVSGNNRRSALEVAMNIKKSIYLSLGIFMSFGLWQPAFAQQGATNCGPFMGAGWGTGWHGWFLGPLFMLAFLAAAVAVVVLIVRALTGSHSGPSHLPPGSYNLPLDILKERFAKGEIDSDEFEERRKILS